MIKIFDFRNKDKNRWLVIQSSTSRWLRIPVCSLVYIKADGNYCNAYLKDTELSKNKDDKETCLQITMQLGELESIIDRQFPKGKFCKIDRSHIINTDFVLEIDITMKKLVLGDGNGTRFVIRPAADGLKLLRDSLEKIYDI